MWTQRIKEWLKAVLPPRILIYLYAVKYRYAGEHEIRLLPYLCDREKASIDVGASNGVYTYFLSRYSRLCYAFEPYPHYARFLERAFGRRVEVRNVALSNQTGTCLLKIPVVSNKERPTLATIEADNDLSGFDVQEMHTVCVQTQRLDDLHLSAVGFIKIDVEGHEMAVLEGATQSLKRDSPSLLVESEERHNPGSIERLLSFMSDLGYTGFFLLDGKLQPIDQFDPAIHQNCKNLDAEGKAIQGVYINNFIFVKSPPVIERLSRFMTC